VAAACINKYFVSKSKLISPTVPAFNTTKAINDSNLHLLVHFRYATIFIKGKVFAEEFEREPKLINWLRRLSTNNCRHQFVRSE